MNKMLLSSLAAASLVLASSAGAATLVDTGMPSGTAVGSLVFDGSDWVAAQVTFANAVTIDAISGYLSGATAGETFDISLYDGGAKPGAQDFTTTATYGADGWNGASGLGWAVAPGSYWIEFEVNWWDDTLGDTSTVTGPLFATGVANPVQTATTPDGGFTYDDAPSIGLRVSSVPEPAAALQLAAGALLLASLGWARRRRG